MKIMNHLKLSIRNNIYVEKMHSLQHACSLSLKEEDKQNQEKAKKWEKIGEEKRDSSR